MCMYDERGRVSNEEERKWNQRAKAEGVCEVTRGRKERYRDEPRAGPEKIKSQEESTVQRRRWKRLRGSQKIEKRKRNDPQEKI